jgi:hypothetical protein
MVNDLLHHKAAWLHQQRVEKAADGSQGRARDPVPADQPGGVVLGDQREDPYPVLAGDPDRERPGRVEHLYPHDRAAWSQRELVSQLDVLILRQDPVALCMFRPRRFSIQS